MYKKEKTFLRFCFSNYVQFKAKLYVVAETQFLALYNNRFVDEIVKEFFEIVPILKNKNKRTKIKYWQILKTENSKSTGETSF